MIETAAIVLPAIATTGDSSRKLVAYVDRQETFSEAYMGKLPNRYLRELAFCYVSFSGTSYTTIGNVNSMLHTLCDFSVKNNVQSVGNLDDLRVVRSYFEFLRRNYVSVWEKRFFYFRLCFKDRLTNVVWPFIRRDTNPTIGHTPYAYTEMLIALRQEIDRIRNKVGLWDAAVKNGKILTFNDLEPSKRLNQSKLTVAQMEELAVDLEKMKGVKGSIPELARRYGIGRKSLERHIAFIENLNSEGKTLRSEITPLVFSKDDLIATINYFMPGWPAVDRFPSTKRYRVYRSLKGVLLGSFDNEAEASEIAKANDGIVVYNASCCFNAQINPAEYLLYKLSHTNSFRLTHHLVNLTGSVPQFIEEYWPTAYDITCVIMYWALLNGWNRETIQSVTAQDLGFIFPQQNVINLISSEHISIRGYKRRGQPEDKDKEYVHVSDKSDEYGLYRVLSDMFTLTKLFRRYLKGDERKCILAGINPTVGGHFITVFGPSRKCMNSPLGESKVQCLRFFTEHQIFEDEGRTERITYTDTMKIRTSYESMLEFLGVPIDIMRLFMGHETMDTTMTAYGSDPVSFSIRREQLRSNLVELSEKAFQGTLKRYKQVKKQKKGNVIQLFMHSGNPVFVCKNRTAPTWQGHKKYVTDGNCNHLEECLFCKQCICTEESLPFLLRWKRDIDEWLAESPSDMNRHLLDFLQAIEEVLKLCYDDGRSWLKALNNAEIKEMDPDFVAPPFWIKLGG